MRVLYDHQLFSLQDAGGGSRYFFELAKFMARVPEVQMEMLLGMNNSVHPLRALGSETTRVMSVGSPLGPGVWRYVANEVFNNLVAPFRGKMDVYHSTLYRCVPLVRAKRIVATHHDCVQERFPQLFPDVERIRSAKRALFRRADAIICVSEASRKDLLSFYGVDAAKTRVIHPGVSRLAPSNGSSAELRRHLRRPYILYVSLRAPHKNFDGMLTAFHDAGLKESLDILVLGGGRLTPEHKNLITRLGLADCVITLPIVSEGVLAGAYAGARLFVYPSLCEGFGSAPLEAMSAGCPVLASRIPAICEVCQNVPFYFEPEDTASFTRALLHALQDEPARNRAVEKGKEVAARYGWEKCGEQTLALYRDCQ